MTSLAASQRADEVPIVNDVVVREFVRGLMRQSEMFTQTVILLDGRYDPAAPRNLVVDGMEVRVADSSSVLGAMQACLDHRLSHGLLVLFTTRDEQELGVDVCSLAVKHRRLPVHRWQIVLRRFGARDLDPRLRRQRWVADGLLETEPPQGWPKLPGAVLDYDTALRQLARRRLNIIGDALDATELLTLSPADFAGLERLRPDERQGLEQWLTNSVGPASVVLLALARAGHSVEALPFGLVAGVLWENRPNDLADAALARIQGRAQGRAESMLGTPVESAQVIAFAEASRGVVTRWLTHAEGVTAADAEHRQRIETVLHQADCLLIEFGAADLAERGELLDAGLRARLRTLAACVGTALDGRAESHAAMESALDRVATHDLVSLRAEQFTHALMTVRLARWLRDPAAEPRTVAEGVRSQVRDWGWVDRAVAMLWFGEPLADPATAAVYARVHDEVRAVRDRLDAQFATRLAAWVSMSAASDGLLLVEQVLEQIVAPLAHNDAVPPLLIVVDGMSTAVAVQLAEQIRALGLSEVARSSEGREGALAVIPSVTGVSRTSLLCGRLASGVADTERAGFTAFWKSRRLASALFHKADLPGGTGHRLAEPVQDAISRIDGSDRTVVGVVLNTVDDALDHGREGGRVDWNLSDITFLPELLAAAKRYGRPVVIVSDHGHVLERERGAPSGEDATSARWRPQNRPPGDGEIELSGDRVLLGNGRIVAPWRETIRYTARKAGYHGGASLAEMTVPVLAFLPAPDAPMPHHWHVVSPERVTPPWWSPRTTAVEAVQPAPVSRKKRQPAAEQADALFESLTASPASGRDTLGWRVIGSSRYAAQQRYVRKAPDQDVVAAIVDALVRSGDRLSVAALAEVADTPALRVPGLVAMLRRLLNVEGYQVLALIDGGKTLELDRGLLYSQFELAGLKP
ncbi:BREX-2 system phosphatase PglZ [Micromonospora sp. NPDC049523]|uniref:BREX-2 system phosphatase PglZ n=1 Tax=Micromonospora sp. NPDC049523 TaxID=3155921 RepID=UPI00342E4A61